MTVLSVVGGLSTPMTLARARGGPGERLAALVPAAPQLGQALQMRGGGLDIDRLSCVAVACLPATVYLTTVIFLALHQLVSAIANATQQHQQRTPTPPPTLLKEAAVQL